MKSVEAKWKRERGIHNEDCSQAFFTRITSSPFNQKQIEKKCLLAITNIAL